MSLDTELDIEEIKAFCKKFAVPPNHLLDILKDLKVIPMIRGKGFEYFVYEELKENLDSDTWEIHKYNTNPQRNATDADLVAKHLSSNEEVIIECKTAVRGSFKVRGQICKEPHFRVKCHKSRSNNQRTFTNDRYFVDEFDIIFSTPANSFIESGVFQLIQKPQVLEILENTYGYSEWDNVMQPMSSDLRLALTTSIASDDNTVPRSPIVKLNDDPNWVTFNNVEDVFNTVVRRKQAQGTRQPTISSHLLADE